MIYREDLYNIVLKEDRVTLITYLNDITNPNRGTIDFINSLTQYAVSKGKAEMAKILTCYAGSPATWNNFALFYFNTFGNEEIKDFLENGTNEECPECP